MSEVSAPVIAVGLVLSAVFIPCAFITGITGQFFRQFALTIASSTIISTINSLTLSPALAAMLLQPRVKGQYQALPRLAFVALGAWQGYVRLGPYLLPFVHSSGLMGRVASASLVPEVGSGFAATPAVAAGLAGALLGGLRRLGAQQAAQPAARPVLRPLQPWLHGNGRPLFPRWSAACCGSSSWFSWSTPACCF